MSHVSKAGHFARWRASVLQINSSIGLKIILPYLLLTLVVAAIGAFIVTQLVTSSLTERINNQLLDAGESVSNGMIDHETRRLEVLRAVAFSEGVADSLAASDKDMLATIVPQIAANSVVDTVSLVNLEGIEVFGWWRQSSGSGTALSTGTDFSIYDDVRLVLGGYTDGLGDKRVVLRQSGIGPILYTVGPVKKEDQLVGAVVVGSRLRNMLISLTENAVARVTLYEPDGSVLDTTLGGESRSASEALQLSPETYNAVTSALQESPDQYLAVSEVAGSEVPLKDIVILDQDYKLAYGTWKIRGASLGLFSVALRSNFIVTSAVTSRTQLSIIFSLATLAVFGLGYFIAAKITQPLGRLVQTSLAISHGQLSQRTGIDRADEIGTLARSFDTMTANLESQNTLLVKQAGELEAILQGIADGVLVLDSQRKLVTANPAARQILSIENEHSHADDNSDLLSTSDGLNSLLALDFNHTTQKLQIGDRVYSALASPVNTEGGGQSGNVIVLRDVTREAEVEELKDLFITSVSHELRTPLTSIAGFVELMMASGSSKLDEQQMQFAKVISSNTAKMTAHINKLIDIAEIQNETLKLRQQPEPFARLVRETCASWNLRMEQKRLDFRLEIGDDQIWVTADPVRLAWAIENLIKNAHDFTEEGGSVEVRVFEEQNQARLDITDTGVGIEEVDLPYLFTRFFRIQNEQTMNIPGIGLDLFISRSIIKAHGGQIWVESKPRHGSVFSLVLPSMPSPHSPADH